ncbi:MAG TPA: phospholipase [Porphyromonadaceae bacterium]|nr:phospholipase [Porphyromonadaceae bacterium]
MRPKGISLSSILLFLFLFTGKAFSQMNSAIPPCIKREGIGNDSLYAIIEKEPAFGIYRDNYFITGFNPSKKIDQYNADLRFQISLRACLTRCTLPLKSYLFVSYTQNTTWDIYQYSAPFRYTDYNPALHWAKPFITKNRLMGLFMLSLEHQSNGKSGPLDRDCNWITLYGKYYFHPTFSLEGKIYIPVFFCPENRDIHKYKGFINISANYCSLNRKFRTSLQFQKTTKSIVSGNFIAEVAYALYLPFNIFAFAQYYNGYAENITEFTTYFNEIRIGLCFKTSFFDVH